MRYERLTIIERYKSTRPTRVKAICDCGTIKDYFLGNITKGATKSCGCYHRDKTRIRNNKNIKYGLSSHPLRKVWGGMLERCYNKSSVAYKNYGERGIEVCDTWKINFVNFYNWAITNGYQQGLEIDRRDNNESYTPENCRFVTTKENSRNRRSNILVTYKGVTKILKEWAEDLGLNYKRLHKDLRTKGRTFEESIQRQLC